MPRCLIVLTLLCACCAQAQEPNWPMLAHDAARSGATTNEVQPPFSRKWYRLFTDEGLMSGVQPIIADGKVFLGTLRGRVHALDNNSGQDLWVYQAGGAILQTMAWANGKVFFGSADGTVAALNAADGKLAWELQTGAAVWNAPAVHDGVVYIGSRDHQLYAIDARNGDIKWAALTDGPLLGSPAVDPKLQRVYVGAEDMRVYAFDLNEGRLVWRTDPLPGVSLRGYHPVIAPDGSVLITTAPGIGVDTFQALLLEMAKEIFGDFASWRHSREANDTLRAENFALMQKPETFPAQLEFIRKRLTAEPSYQTFFVIDPATGRQKFVAPIVYSESMNGPGAPALVGPGGKVIVKFQALLRSRYEHYSPFLNVGYLDTATGNIEPIMDQSRIYGWHDSLLLVHDEQSQLAVAGRILINTHQDNVNALDLQTRQGFPDPFCRNVHEPRPGEAMAIWKRLLANEPLPPGKEWLARGTAVYGGGSVLDTSVTIAGDSFYYLPTHELNAGVALIAYRMDPGATNFADSPLPAVELTTNEWARVKELPWDWDSLDYRRLTHILDALPEPVPGTRAAPLNNEAAEALANIKNSDLDRIIWHARQGHPSSTSSVYVTGLKKDLSRAVEELISTQWQPLTFPSGKFPEEAYRFFNDPAETLHTLTLAYPFLSSNIQEQVKAHVASRGLVDRALQAPVAQEANPAAGELRSAYVPPPDKLLKFQADVLRTELARLYVVWSWAHAAGEWAQLDQNWTRLEPLVRQRPSKMEEDCRNSTIAGLIAYCRLADRAKDTNAVEAGVETTRRTMLERLNFEYAHTRGGLIWQVPRMRSTFSRWHFLTPEVGRFLREQVPSVHTSLMERYVDYHRPTWWLAWNVETAMRNECPYEFPTMSLDIFTARRFILDEPAQKLAPFIDRPWCRADEYYIQKLALTLDAALPSTWADIREPQG